MQTTQQNSQLAALDRIATQRWAPATDGEGWFVTDQPIACAITPTFVPGSGTAFAVGLPNVAKDFKAESFNTATAPSEDAQFDEFLRRWYDVVLRPFNPPLMGRWHDAGVVVVDEAPSTQSTSTTKELIEHWLAAPSELQNRLFDLLLASSSPEDIVQCAFRVYDETYRESVLLMSAAILERKGPEAWSALRLVASSVRAECELFISVIADCPGVPDRAKAAALRNLARNPHPEVRRRVLEACTRLSPQSLREVARAFSDDTDEEIREEAGAMIES